MDDQLSIPVSPDLVDALAERIAAIVVEQMREELTPKQGSG